MEGDGRRRTWGKVSAVLAEKKTGGPVVSELEGRHSQRGSLAVSKENNFFKLTVVFL